MAALATSRQQANPFDDSDDDEPTAAAVPPPPPPPIDSPYNAMSPTYTMSYPEENGADNADDTNGKIICLAVREGRIFIVTTLQTAHLS